MPLSTADPYPTVVMDECPLPAGLRHGRLPVGISGWATMSAGGSVFRSMTTENLLGPLNHFERTKLPNVLYYSGKLALIRRSPRVAIVGSRSASERGLSLARRLAEHVANVGGVVVSGLAKGVDRAAHEGAIEAGGATIAVLGTPLDRSYPRENRDLQEHLMREHLVLSQFEAGSTMHKSNFVQRNRTMALVSHATVIVEAGATSGTQSQAWEAIRLGRQLYLHESMVQAGYDWVQKLLRYGAITFEELEDLLLDPLINPHAELVWE